MKVVIFKLNAFGDNVVFVSAVQALRSRCPDWHITLITTPNEAELYQGRLAPQEILTSPKHDFNKSHHRPWVLASWIWRVRRRRPDGCLLAFDQGSAAHLIAKLSGARMRIGGNVAHIRVRDSLTLEVPYPEDARPVTWNWRMARALAGALGSDAGWPDEPPPPDLSHLPHGVRPADGRRRVVVHSGASRSLNRWSGERFASVAAALARDYEVVWIIHGEATGPAPAGTKGVAVRSIGEFAHWVGGADLFLGNNSGPMHLANAIGCPGVAVSGPSAAGWDPFWFRERWSVLRHPDLYCAPCGKPNEQVPGCANLASPMACLEYWTTQKVEAACRLRLERINEGAR
jgi:heptosyltransferase-2